MAFDNLPTILFARLPHRCFLKIALQLRDEGAAALLSALDVIKDQQSKEWGDENAPIGLIVKLLAERVHVLPPYVLKPGRSGPFDKTEEGISRAGCTACGRNEVKEASYQ